MADPATIQPAHSEDTVRAIARLHAEHEERATPTQRFMARMTSWVGRPSFVGGLTLLVLAWALANVAEIWVGKIPWDPPPFSWLQGVVSLVALYTTVLILATQRREDQLAARREHLALELALLNEHKSAKIIHLLEEMRRDSPFLQSRVDHEAAIMSQRADPQSVLDALRLASEDPSLQERPEG